MRGVLGSTFGLAIAILVSSATAQIRYIDDDRRVDMRADFASIAGGNFVSQDDSDGATPPSTPAASPANPNPHLNFAGAANARVISVSGRAVLNSVLSPFRIQASGSTSQSLSVPSQSGGGSDGQSNFSYRIAIDEPQGFSFSGRYSASITTPASGEVEVDLRFESSDGSVEILNDSVRLGAGEGPESGDFNIVGTLQPGTYIIDFDGSGFFTEVENESGELRTEWTFVLDMGDRDGDGLADIWECPEPECGIDGDGDGIADLRLADMGANPDRKDLFVEVDSMVGFAPLPGFTAPLVAAFGGAPVDNPDGSKGISLHVLLDETDIPAQSWSGPDPMVEVDPFTFFDPVKALRYGSPAQRADPNWDAIREARRLAVRYCIFAQEVLNGDAGGYGEVDGDDFMVTAGPAASASIDIQRSVFMHELGHNLGLRHGGGDDINAKPNYYSIMNYRWIYPRPWKGWRLSYSEAALNTLDEGALAEQIGIVSPPGLYSGVEVPYVKRSAADPQELIVIALDIGANTPIDWDYDGVIDTEPLADDINFIFDSDSASPSEVLRGHNDWAVLRYALAGAANFASGAAIGRESKPEMFTLDQYLAENAEFLADSEPDPCPPDLDGNGVLDAVDVEEQITRLDGSGAADTTGDGLSDFFDLLEYLKQFDAGCP